MDFLARIMEGKRAEVGLQKERTPVEQLRDRAVAARACAPRHRLRERLSRDAGFHVIAEIKRRSPSAGDLRNGAEPGAVAVRFAGAGAAAISVLTDAVHFGGSIEDLREVRSAVDIPILRKEFILDAWQVYEAAAAGADAVLLIVGGLQKDSLQSLRQVAEEELAMDALVEVHTAEELELAAGCGASLIGINNRDLKNLTTDVEISFRLVENAPRDARLVSESGIRSGEDLRRLRAAGFHGFLIGETFMRASDPGAALEQMLAEAQS